MLTICPRRLSRHEWQHCLDHRDCSEDVDVELTPHLFERTLLKSPFVAVSCTVDEDVYRTNISFGPCTLGTDGCEIRDIQYDGSRVYGVHRAELPSRCFASHRANHGITGRERFTDQSPPEAGTSTRDQKIPLSNRRHILPPKSCSCAR
jgi:hypothetical protein